MKIKAKLVTATHETKYGTDYFSRIVKKNEIVDAVIDEIKDEADYDETNSHEYFDSNITDIIIDTDDYELAESITETYNVKGIDDLEGLTFAICSTEEKAKRAQALLEKADFVDCTKIVKSKIGIDKIIINDKTIDL